MRFEEILTVWLPRQRWFAGKGSAIRDLGVVAETVLVAGDPELRHLVIAVSHDGTVDKYQVLVGLRTTLPDRLRHAMIGRLVRPDGTSVVIYDAVHDSELTSVLLRAIAAERDTGRLRFRRAPSARINTKLESLVLTGEQSNTSLVYGQEAILKLFRRLTPGANPDLEVTSALARLGSAHIAQPFGWIEMDLEDTATTVAILSEYLRTASDGWSLAQTSVRDLYAGEGIGPEEAGGDFAGEAGRLGAATAEIHCDLADAFGVSELEPDAIAELAAQMREKLENARAVVPALARHADFVQTAFDDFAKLDNPMRVQRIHGDYHLGQVVRTEAGWIVLDFEGEPATPLAARRAPTSPLRDVAGMLRSFDYAARAQLIGHPHEDMLRGAAYAWTQRNRAAFCEGYAEVSGSDPRLAEATLRAFELEKAVYEVVYEARHRPSWLPIPLDSLGAAA
ncbi:MAG TPA: phosphotransferase [Streptosporangiaceae bacterium]|nr:phosphotransferase [Streptosporangiaceae bacterium]